MNSNDNTTEHAEHARTLRVLVVDDSQTIRASARALLTDLGHEVEVAEDGFAALARLARFDADIIFIDVVMPRLDGYETTSLLRINPILASVPVIMMSSKGGAFDVAKGKLIGCDDYVIKPFEKDALLQVLQRYAGAGQTRGAAATVGA